MRCELPGDRDYERLTENEVAVIEAAIVLSTASERLAVLKAGAQWGEGWVSECQEATRDYARARIAFRLALGTLRRQGES